MEFSYYLPTNFVKRLGLTNFKLYVNGNNLIYWSDLPTDLESGSWDVYNSYPTYKVLNMGIDVIF